MSLKAATPAPNLHGYSCQNLRTTWIGFSQCMFLILLHQRYLWRSEIQPVKNNSNILKISTSIILLNIDCLKRYVQLNVFLFQVFLSFFFFLNIYLFIWLRQVLVAARGIFTAACGIFSCSMWDFFFFLFSCSMQDLRCGVRNL